MRHKVLLPTDAHNHSENCAEKDWQSCGETLSFRFSPLLIFAEPEWSHIPQR